jgi:hypothetical protein
MSLIQPSDFTFQDYYKMTNPSNKWHDDDSYSASINSLNKYDWIDDFTTVEQRFRVNGIDFEIRESKDDKRKWNILKKDSEGECIYEKNEKGNNQVVYYSEEEKEKLIPENKRYKIEHAVIESKTNKIVSMTQDEWGALLITSAKEFKGFAIGQKLLNHHRKKFPVRDSGGHTPQGYQAVFKFYQEQVKNSLIKGEYRQKIKDGSLTTTKVKDIISSARLSELSITKEDKENHYDWILGDKTYSEKKKNKLKNKVDLDMTDPKDILLLVQDNYAILYNKKVLDNIENIDREYFVERGLLGYAYVGGTFDSKDIPKVHRLYGKNENIEKFMMEVMFNQFKGEPLRVYSEEDYLISSNLRDSMTNMGKDSDSLFTTYQLNSITNDSIKIMQFIEKKHRTSIDPYQEKKMLLEENLYGISEDIETSRETIKDVILNNIGNNSDSRRFALDIVRKTNINDLEKLKNQLTKLKPDERKSVLLDEFGITSENSLTENKIKNQKKKNLSL